MPWSSMPWLALLALEPDGRALVGPLGYVHVTRSTTDRAVLDVVLLEATPEIDPNAHRLEAIGTEGLALHSASYDVSGLAASGVRASSG